MPFMGDLRKGTDGNLIWLVLGPLIGVAIVTHLQAGGLTVDWKRPVVALSGGHEVRLGMARSEVIAILGQPPTGYDEPDEALWPPPADVWRCFFEDDRVVAFQTSHLFQDEQLVLDQRYSRAQIYAKLGRTGGGPQELVYFQGNNRIVIATDHFFGETTSFIGVAAPGFDHRRLYSWCQPLADDLSLNRQPFAKGDKRNEEIL